MTVRQLLEHIGVSHSSLTRMELGATRSVPTDALVSLATALGVSIDELVKGTAVPPRDQSPAGSPVDYYPFPAYSVKSGGLIDDVNAELLALTGWPKSQLGGMQARLVPVRYPSGDQGETDLLVTRFGDIHVPHRVVPATLSPEMDVHMVHLCTPESIAETLVVYSFMLYERHGMEGLPPSLKGAVAQVRRFGMRGVSVWFTDPATKEGIANLYGGHVVDPPMTSGHIQHIRTAAELGEPYEYHLPGLDGQLRPQPLGCPRRAISLPISQGVLTFGWAGELTLMRFDELTDGIASRITSMLDCA